MTKNVVWFILVIIVGALLGSFLGKFIAIVIPDGSIRNLFATDIAAGLHPATLDLRVIELTFGCLFKFNISSLLGIVISALIFKGVSK